MPYEPFHNPTIFHGDSQSTTSPGAFDEITLYGSEHPKI